MGYVFLCSKVRVLVKPLPLLASQKKLINSAYTVRIEAKEIDLIIMIISYFFRHTLVDMLSVFVRNSTY